LNVEIFQETIYVTMFGQMNPTQNRAMICQIIFNTTTGRIHIFVRNFQIMTPVIPNEVNYHANFANYE